MQGPGIILEVGGDREVNGKVTIGNGDQSNEGVWYAVTRAH